jgi:hypothetical protein
MTLVEKLKLLRFNHNRRLARDYDELEALQGFYNAVGMLIEIEEEKEKCTCSYDDSEEMTRHAKLCPIYLEGYNEEVK